MHLNVRNQVISVQVVAIGSLVHSIVHTREIFKAAILQNASGIICGHNHPSGSLVSSNEDIAVLKRLKAAGTIIGIKVLDFLVVSADESRSLIYQES